MANRNLLKGSEHYPPRETAGATMLSISPCCLPQTRRSPPCSVRPAVLANHLIWRALRALRRPIFGASRIFSLISGTLGRGADRDFFDFAADEGLELGEIGGETPSQLARALVIG